MYNRNGYENQLFDLRDDPRELEDLSASMNGKVEELKGKLEDWMKRQATARERGGWEHVEMDEETKKELKALGYVD